MKKVNSTVLVVFSMALVSILCLLLGASYSYILSNGSAANTETINTGNLNATITYNVAQYGNMTATSDSEAASLGNYATVEIKKNNQYSVYYQLNLGYTSTFQSGQIDSYLPLENVEVALYKISDNGDTIGDDNNPVMGPIRVADLPVVKSDETSDSADAILKAQYQLYVGKFETGNQTVKYALKAWIADDTDEEFNGKQVSLDLTVNQEPYRSKNIYNLTFNLENGTENGEASNTELYLNGQKATSDGGYKISNIPEGIYTLIVKKDSKTYETTLTIKTGDKETLTKVSNEGEQASGKSLQKLAFDKKTTVYQIMKKNLSIQNSNKLTQYKLYNMPNSYELTLKPSLDVQSITGIKVQLNEQTNDITLTYEAATSVVQAEGQNVFESVVPTVEMFDGDEGGAA